MKMLVSWNFYLVLMGFQLISWDMNGTSWNFLVINRDLNTNGFKYRAFTTKARALFFVEFKKEIHGSPMVIDIGIEPRKMELW